MFKALYCAITNTAESQWMENKDSDVFKTEIIELTSISLLSRESTADAFTLMSGFVSCELQSGKLLFVILANVSRGKPL